MKKTFLVFLLTLGACSSKTSDRYREGNNDGQRAALTVEEEKTLTREALSEMRNEYPPAKNPALQAYVTRLGQKLVQANKLHNRPYTYTFTVVDTPQVNAFALPAGTIYITTPIIAMADTEAEIAGVLGHEIGHVTARHTAERMYVAKKEQSKTIAFGAIGAAVLGTAGYFVSKKLCDPKDLECKAKMIGGGAVVGAAGGLFVQKYAFMKNSQEDELESDRVGFRYATNAGYDKEKVGDFYKKLMALERESKKGQNAALSWLADAMASHPSSDQRVSQAEEMRGLVKTSGGVTVTPDFLRMKKLAQEMVDAHRQKK
jgi:predicted Zn-dependent protease